MAEGEAEAGSGDQRDQQGKGHQGQAQDSEASA